MYIWGALATTAYNPRQLGGERINWAKILWGWSLPECFAFSHVILHPPSISWMAPPFNVVMRATGEYTTMCVVRESPVTQQALPQGLSSPGKNWGYWLSKFNPLASTSGHPSTNWGQCCLTCRIWLPPYVPCQVTTDLATLHENTSWVITFITCHIDKWNLYCSYTIKCIFISIRKSRFDRAKIFFFKFTPQRHFFSGMLTRTKNVNLFGLNAILVCMFVNNVVFLAREGGLPYMSSTCICRCKDALVQHQLVTLLLQDQFLRPLFELCPFRSWNLLFWVVPVPKAPFCLLCPCLRPLFFGVPEHTLTSISSE